MRFLLAVLLMLSSCTQVVDADGYMWKGAWTQEQKEQVLRGGEGLCWHPSTVQRQPSNWEPAVEIVELHEGTSRVLESDFYATRVQFDSRLPDLERDARLCFSYLCRQ